MPQRGHITADPGLAQAKKTSAFFKSLIENPHGQHGASVREDFYKGHRIIIRTTYEIEIDGRPFHGSLDVSNAGTVQYHGIPNVSSNSAVELVRSVIDTFPDDFSASEHGEDHSHRDEGTRDSNAITDGRAHLHRDRGRMKSSRKRTAQKPARMEKRHARSRKHSR